MKFYSERATFKGKIDGKCVNDLKKLNFNIDNSLDRIELVENILNDCEPLISGYIDKYYKVSTTNELSDDINIFKNIEMLGTYILNSKDLPTESKQEYKIFTDEKLFMKATKENEGDYENALMFLKNNKRNEYLVKTMTIEASDFEDERLKEYLTSYKLMLDYIKEQLSKASKGEKISIQNIKLAKKISKELKDDMILTKEKLIRPIKLPINGDFTTKNDWDKFNYTSREHIKAMLYINRSCISPDDDISLIRYDIDCAIKHLKKNKKLDKKDLIILDLIRKDKSYTYEDIGFEIQMSKQAVSSRINRIVNKIVKYFAKKNF